MGELIARFAREGALQCAPTDGIRVLDVGSRDFNGSYKPLVVERGWSYTGLDVEPGANVDITSEDPYNYPIDCNSFDLVISGSTMEHVPAVWLWVPELVRVLRPGGMLGIVTHWQFQEHRWPDLGILDCWRILPDGMRYLFDRAGGLERYEIGIVSEYDVAGSAWKWAHSNAPLRG